MWCCNLIIENVKRGLCEPAHTFFNVIDSPYLSQNPEWKECYGQAKANNILIRIMLIVHAKETLTTITGVKVFVHTQFNVIAWEKTVYLGAGWSRIPLLLQSMQIMNDDPAAIHFEQILFCKLV